MSENAPARKSSSGMAETRSLGADFSFNDIWLFLRRYVLTIALAVAASVAAAGYMAFSATPEFTATAQILIDPALSQALRDPARNNGGSGNLPLDTAQVEGQIAVLHSESIAFAVIDRLQLVDDPEFTGKGAPSLVKRVINFFTRGFELAAPSEPSAEFANYLKRRAAVEAFASNLDVRRVGPTYAINISYTSQYPEKAASIANATADAYIQGQLKVNGKAAQQGSEWLEKRLVQLRTQLSEAARRAELFKTGRNFHLPQTRSDVGGQGTPSAHRDVEKPVAERYGLPHAKRRPCIAPSNAGGVGIHRRKLPQDLRNLPAGVRRRCATPVVSGGQRPCNHRRHASFAQKLAAQKTYAGAGRGCWVARGAGHCAVTFLDG
ncbi:MAG: Wzz/FepE/Etk N-terminal domain-containing protein [Alphaproteobacteria bacterium]